MIVLSMFGPFHFALSLTLLPLFLTFLLMCAYSLAPLSRFDNSSAHTFFLTQGAVLRMSCLYISKQNGKVERALHTINNILRTLLFQGSLPPVYWADTLHTATYLFNRHPTKTLDGRTPFFALYGTHPSYAHLRVFGC